MCFVPSTKLMNLKQENGLDTMTLTDFLNTTITSHFMITMKSEVDVIY